MASVPEGEEASSFTVCVELDPEADPPSDLITNTEWKKEEIRARIPFTGDPLLGTIDFESHLESVGRINYESMEHITQTLDSLYADDAIRTPFSSDLEKEREIIVQQTLWIFTSELSGVELRKSTQIVSPSVFVQL